MMHGSVVSPMPTGFGRPAWRHTASAHRGSACPVQAMMKGFISYAHKDHAVLERLLEHLRPMERTLHLTFWHDKHIDAGHRWNDEIEKAIDAAEVFILLASPAFMASPFIVGKEIPAIKKQRRKCRGVVIPVLVRACAWQLELGAIQAVPRGKDGAWPIERWNPRNDGYDTARQQIDTAICKHFGLRPRQRQW